MYMFVVVSVFWCLQDIGLKFRGYWFWYLEDIGSGI